MALDTTKVFTILGKYIKHTNIFDGWLDEFAADEAEVNETLTTAEMDDVIDDLPDFYASISGEITSFITNTLKAREDEIFLDQELVLDELSLVSKPSVRTVLEEIYDIMEDDNDFLDNNNLPAGAQVITYDTTNTDSFGLLVVGVLDGTTSPVSGIPSFLSWNGVDSSLFINGLLEVRCIADSETNGLVRGSEQFQIRYGIPNSPFNPSPEGYGQTNVTCINNTSLVPGTFESWNAIGAVGWTNLSGTFDTDFQQAEDVGARLTDCLQLNSSGNSIELITYVSLSTLVRHRTYLLSCLARIDSPTAGSAELSLVDTVGANIGTPIDLLTAGVDWTPLFTTCTIPDAFEDSDDSPGVKIFNSGANEIFVDDVVLTPLTYFGGLNIMVVAIDSKILIGDKGSVTIGHANNGIIAEFLRKQYKFQLPMNSISTISDVLAQ